MRVALIGPRGSGKTSVARLLADRLKLALVCVDELVEKEQGALIAKIVETKGWEAFRQWETKCLEKALNENEKKLVLDCGGGIVEAKVNREILSARLDCVVFLNGDPKTLTDRLKSEMANRPSLTDHRDELAEMKQILSRRLPLYRQVSGLEIDTSLLTLKQVAERIMESLKLHEG